VKAESAIHLSWLGGGDRSGWDRRYDTVTTSTLGSGGERRGRKRWNGRNGKSSASPLAFAEFVQQCLSTGDLDVNGLGLLLLDRPHSRAMNRTSGIDGSSSAIRHREGEERKRKMSE
jgi:hypothetical protein